MSLIGAVKQWVGLFFDKGGAHTNVRHPDFGGTNFGAKGDGRVVADAAILSGFPTLSSVTALFTTADVGKAIVVAGAGTPTAGSGTVSCAAGVATFSASQAAALGNSSVIIVAGTRYTVTAFNGTTGATLSGAPTFGASAFTISTQLSTTILAYVDPITVTLAANAGASVTAANAVFWRTNDTVAFNDAYNYQYSLGGGRVFVPAGVYMIDADWRGGKSILPKSGVELVFARNATLQAIPNALQSSAVIFGMTLTNVSIRGGTIQGDRKFHLGFGGEWGHCIQLGQCTDATIESMSLKDAWGDGLNIGNYQDPGTGAVTPSTESERPKIDKVLCDNNRRNGCSLTAARNYKITHSDFNNSNGTGPEGGLDLEPNPGIGAVEEGIVDHCQAKGNNAYGFIFTAGVDGVTGSSLRAINNGVYGYYIYQTAKRLQLSNLSFVGNGAAQIGVIFLAGGGLAASDHQIDGFNASGTYDKAIVFSGPGASGYGRNHVSRFKITGTFNYGVYMFTQADSNIVGPGEVIGAAQIGVYCLLGDDNNFPGVIARSCATYGIRTQGFGNIVGPNAKAISNTLVGIYQSGAGSKTVGSKSRLNGGNGIEQAQVDDGEVSGNTVDTNSQTADLASHNIRITGAAARPVVRDNIIRKGVLANRPAHGINISGSTVTNAQVLDNDTATGGATREVNDAGTDSVIRNKRGNVALAYSASMAPSPFDGERQLVTVTNGVAMVLANPADNGNAVNYKGLRLIVTFFNNSGGVMGALTFGANLKTTGAFTVPANGKSRLICFSGNGTNWDEEYRSTADF